MKDYLVSILTVLLVSSLASVLMPEGEGRKSVRFALALLVLVTVLSPFRAGALDNFLSSYTALSFEKEKAEGAAYLLSYEEEALESGVSAAVAQKYGVSTSHFDISVTCEEQDTSSGRTVVVRSLALHLYGRACLSDVPSMVSYLEKELNVECEVIYHG